VICRELLNAFVEDEGMRSKVVQRLSDLLRTEAEFSAFLSQAQIHFVPPNIAPG
jgi:hypothetical protein